MRLKFLFIFSRKKNSGSSLFSAKRKRTGLCKIINCSRSKSHYCCKQELTTTTETTVTTVTPPAPTTTPDIEVVEEEQEEHVPVTEIRRAELTPTTPITTISTTMKPYGDVTEGETITESIQLEEAEATVFSGSGDDEESDGAVASSTPEDTSTTTTTMMSYPDYTHSDDAEMTTGSASILENQTEQPSEEFEEVTRVSKQKSESYEETRIWYDGINEAGEFVEKAEPEEKWSYKDYNGERVLQVYPVYIPAKTYPHPDYNGVDNEVLSNSIDDQHDITDIRNEITCEHVDCLAWPSNKCCSPHVTKKRHSIEEANDKITATIVRIVKSVRWV